MDLVYAKKAQVYDIEKNVALQAKDYETIKILLERLDARVSELKSLIEKEGP
jgi:hypothetical protein